MEYIDYYETLGIDRDASADDIAKAYRKLARKLHPDVNKAADAETQFKRIAEAYEVLKDPEKRRQYDRFGQQWQEHGGSTGSWSAGWETFGQPADGTQGFSRFFEHLFGGRAAGGSWDDLFTQARAPIDREVALSLTLEQAWRGGRQSVTLPSVGGGRKQVNVTIPAGIADGGRLRLSGLGDAAGDGQPGDLYMKIRHLPHPRFRLDGADLHTTVDVPPPTAVLGGKVTLQTLDKAVRLTVPPGSSSGTKIRLRGQGWPGGPGAVPGDLYAKVRIVVPAHPSPEERSLYEQLDTLNTSRADV